MIKFIFPALLLVCIIACSPKGNQITVSTTSAIAERLDTSYDKITSIDINSSLIHWKGTKPAGSHYGTVALKSGVLYMKDATVKGGKFVIDMNSIVDSDLTDTNLNEKLVGHLKSVDFFDVEKYPTAQFDLISVTPADSSYDDYVISGNLTLKDSIKHISFHALCSKEHKRLTAFSEKFLINRTEWGVNYNSQSIFKNIIDNIINDEIEIQIIINTETIDNIQ